MVYNLTGMGENVTGFLTFTQQVNTHLMQGWYGTMFLIGLCVVLFMLFLFTTGDTGKSISTTSYIAFVLSILLMAMDLIPNLALFIFLVGSATALAFTWNN